MDRNREARRGTIMATPSNGLSSSRRRHRSSSLRDSPDEDGGVEVPEPGRLRDRGVVKKDRGDRDRDRERERSSRSKRRRENRMMIHQVNTGSNRDDGDDTSEESVNDEEEDDDDAGNGGGMRMLPPPPASQSMAAAAVTSNHHNHNPYSQQLHHRKSFPSGNKVFRASAAAPPPAWKAADEMIGVSVPRKARSASTKRSHEWSSGGVGGGGGTELIHRQSSTSPVRLCSSAASPAPVAPPSPSSSNVSVRKKMKANGGSKPRPPKSSSKSSSSNPEELEIEIAEVLYGLMTQSQAPSKKEIPPTDSTIKSSSEIKSKVSSPISNSTSLSTVAPKRKRPRQVSENPFSVRNSPVSSSIKTEMDHHHQQHHQSPKTDISSPYLENSSPASAVAAENGVSSFGFTTLPSHHISSSAPSSEPSLPQEEGKCGVGSVLTKEEVKESPAVGLNDGNSNSEAVITIAASTITTNLKPANPETESKKEEKFEIDLMAPPPQLRTSHESDGDIDFSNHKQMLTQLASKTKEDENVKSGKEELMILTEEQKKSKPGTIHETGELSKQSINADLHIDFEKPNKDTGNRSMHQTLKHQHSSTKSETHTEKIAQQSSLPVPMSVANWPPMGYVAPLQGVISMDGSSIPSAPIQPLFSQPRPKRCATHCYIARNIHCLQQFMKINPFWPVASGSAAPIFGSKHATELHANIPQSIQDKGQPVGIFPGHTTAKDTKSSQSTTVPDPAHRKQQQQVLLQQGMPPVTPNNILHGPAFIFPFNQQQAVAASASVRPGSSKLGSGTTTGASGATNSVVVSSSTTAAAAAAAAPSMSFNYPNMSANETQYLAIVQNHPYAFPIPAVGTSPNYRGNHPHPQAMPLFNGSFYSSQMIHPPQISQPTQQQAPPPTQSHQNSSGSTSSSQKHLQAQQRQQKSGGGAAATAVNGGGMPNSYPAAPKSRSQQLTQQISPHAQARHLENEATGGEDSPSTADSRVSRAATTNTMSVYGPNFAMPVHSQNFALMNPQAGASNSNDKKLQQQQSQQQVLKRAGAESSSLPPQTFAMSFAPMNGTTGISSMAQNHTFFQSMPESSRQSYHHMMTPSAVSAGAPAHHSEQKKDFRISEEASRTTGHDSSNVDDDRKGGAGLTPKSGQSIAFSRPDLATDASGSSAAGISGASVIDSSSSRNINLGSNNRSTRSQMSTSVSPAAQSSHHLHAQFQQQQQQQQILQLQKQQQQQQPPHVNARTKNPPASSNGSGYPEHLITSSSSMMMFPNSLTPFPVQTSNMNSSPVQSPQWRSSVRGGPTTSQVSSSLASSTTSSLKNLHQTHQSQQQQSSRSHPQSHTQISFGAAAAASQKLSAQMQLQPQQQQQQNHNASSNSGNQCPSPPMLVGSPTTSLSSSQPPKNTQRLTQQQPSILGNPHNSTSTKSQQQQQQQQQLPQQLHKQTLTQQQAQAKAYAQMMYTHPYIVQQQQPQAQSHSVGSTPITGYYLPRQKQLTQQVPPQQQSSSSSSAMLSLCPPVTLTNTTTSDPAKAIAAATNNMKGGVGLASQQGGILHAPQYGGAAAAAAASAPQSSVPAGFPQYAHNASAATVQVKPAEQKQPAGE